jgi:hypothetical protein
VTISRAFVGQFLAESVEEHPLGRLARQPGDLVELLHLLFDQLVELLRLPLQRLLAVGDFLLQPFEVFFLAGEFLLLLLGGVLALLGAALQFAHLVSGGFEFAREFFAAPERVVAGLQFGVANDLLGGSARLIEEFVAAGLGAARGFGFQRRVAGRIADRVGGRRGLGGAANNQIRSADAHERGGNRKPACE